MPLSADGIHMLREAVLRLITEVSKATGDNLDDDSVRQVRSLCGALMAAIPQAGMRSSAAATGASPAELARMHKPS